MREFSNNAGTWSGQKDYVYRGSTLLAAVQPDLQTYHLHPDHLGTLNKASYPPTHPILFLFDFLNESMIVPEYDSKEVVSANDSCVSIRTIADVDGDVTVTLANTLLPDANGVEVFGGAIAAPSKRVAVVTPHNEKLIEMEVQGERVTVRIVVDDEAYPCRIWIEAR